MRRVLWTAGTGVAGLLLGLKGQDTQADTWWTALAVIWAASIGYGFGTIFEQKRPAKRLVIYWAATLALVSSFIGLLASAGVQPYASVAQRTVFGVIGGLVGTLFGVFFGTTQLRRLRRKSQEPRSAAIA